MVASAAGKSAGSASSSMKIKGSMDTGNLDRGFARTKKGFEGVKGQAKSFGSDMMRVSKTVSGLAKKLVFLGVAGVTAMIGIASKAPAVAPAMAKMSVAFGKISRSLGEALAPAFERVAGWLDKLAVWVDANKGKIGDVANKFLDWGAALGEKVWPILKNIGNWAADHPGLFAGILAGLALGPTIMGGISSIAGLVGVMTGATVSSSLLAAFGYLIALGGVAYAGYKGAEYLVDKAQSYTGMNDQNSKSDMSGQTLVSRLPQKAWADMTGTTAAWEDPTNPNSPAHFEMLDKIKQDVSVNGPRTGARMSAAEDRRGWFLQWWDATWG